MNRNKRNIWEHKQLLTIRTLMRRFPQTKINLRYVLTSTRQPGISEQIQSVII